MPRVRECESEGETAMFLILDKTGKAIDFKALDTMCRAEWEQGYSNVTGTPTTHQCEQPEGHAGPHVCLFCDASHERE